jgi:hypothetical protein
MNSSFTKYVGCSSVLSFMYVDDVGDLLEGIGHTFHLRTCLKPILYISVCMELSRGACHQPDTLYMQKACQVDALVIGHRSNATQTIPVTPDTMTCHLPKHMHTSENCAPAMPTCQANFALTRTMNQTFNRIDRARQEAVSGSTIILPNIGGSATSAFCQSNQERPDAFGTYHAPLPALSALQLKSTCSGHFRSSHKESSALWHSTCM